MAEEDDRDLPLHDEAKARFKWRDGETIIDKGSAGGSGPASEVDNAGMGGSSGTGGADDSLLGDLIKRPPD
ncbi:MAG TPA: hypothetical protein VGA98_10510 [Allosphingosinicella sp.]|jgi:hypothetical protein